MDPGKILGGLNKRLQKQKQLLPTPDSFPAPWRSGPGPLPPACTDSRPHLAACWLSLAGPAHWSARLPLLFPRRRCNRGAPAPTALSPPL